jgi:hypothetical protein
MKRRKWCQALNDESFQAARKYPCDGINTKASNIKTTSRLGDGPTELPVDSRATLSDADSNGI